MYKIGKWVAFCTPLVLPLLPLAASEWVEGVVTEVINNHASSTTASLELSNSPALEIVEYRLWDEAQLLDNRVSARPAAKQRDQDSDNYSSTNRKDPLMRTSLSKNGIVLYPNFTAFTSDELQSFPPNAAGGAGPTQYLACCVGGIRSFDKSTGIPDGAIDMNTDAFFGLISDGTQTSDPRVRYDKSSDRWFILMSCKTPMRILLAVSDTGILTQNTTWNFFYFTPSEITPQRDLTNLVENFPTFGLDDNALYIGLNLFRLDNGALENSDAFVVRKSSLYGAGPLAVTAFRNLIDANGEGPISPQGVNNFDANPDYGYFVGVDKSHFGKVVMREIKDAATTPSISPNLPVIVFATTYPLFVEHLGNKMGMRGYLDPVDDRLTDSHIRDGKLYTTHNVGVNYRGISSYNKPATRTGCRWYEFDVSTPSAPSLHQAGTVYASSKNNCPYHRSFLIPALMSNGPHSLALGATSSGKYYYINATFAIRHSNDEEGTMRGAYYFTNTPFAYNPPQDPGCMRGRRWGDYAGMSLDPSDNMTFWTIQQYCKDLNTYAVQVARIDAAPPADIVSCQPSSLAAGQNGVTLHLAGERNDGSAFYDPGVGFSDRLTVDIQDVSVTSVNWIDETHVDVVVSTVGSTSGFKRITLSNPDGQYVRANNLFSIE